MAGAPSYLVLLGLCVALGLSFGGALTLCYTIGGRAAPTELRGTSFGFLAMSALLGGAVSPTVAGALARVDIRGIYVLDAGLFVALAALVAFALSAGRDQNQAGKHVAR
jgi:MFS family permease